MRASFTYESSSVRGQAKGALTQILIKRAQSATGVTAGFFLVEVTTERLGRIAELIEHGELKTRIGVVVPLADARDAHLMLEGLRLRPKGKIIINVERAGDRTHQGT